MAQAQTQAFQSSQQGLQSFLDASPDYELAPIGLGSLRGQAEKLAEYGRYGDIYVVHAAEGETVVPMEVLEANPKIKSLLFDQMSEMGLDPERYVVGNDLNSLNPVTGMPEFFFKKLWKSVKGNMPVIAGVVGNMIAPGLGGIIGTGLGTKLAGGSWGDSAKAAALSWGTQAFMSGANQMGKENGSFGSGFMAGLEAPIKGVQGALGSEQYANPFNQGIFSSKKNVGFFPEYDSEYGKEVLGNTVGGGEFELISETSEAPTLKPQSIPEGGFREQGWRHETSIGPRNNLNLPPSRHVSSSEAVYPPTDFASGPKFEPVFEKPPRQVVSENTAANTNDPKVRIIEAPDGTKFVKVPPGYKQMTSTAPSADTGPYLGKLSPSGMVGMPSNLADAAIIGGALYAGGAFEGEEPEKPTTGDLAGVVDPAVTGATLLAENERKFRIGAENLNPNAFVSDEILIPTTFAAQGGTVNYPRRIGQITGPGTGTSDSIPAMLSNGEFVMTKKAVDGAGGPGTMYDMMRNFEMRA